MTDKPKSIREVLEEIARGIPPLNKKLIDSALTAIAGIVEKAKKSVLEDDWGGQSYEEQIEPARMNGWNACCDHIVKLIKGEVTEAEGKGEIINAK